MIALVLIFLFGTIFDATFFATMQSVAHAGLPLPALDQMIGQAGSAIEAPMTFAAAHRLPCPKRATLSIQRVTRVTNWNAAMLFFVGKSIVTLRAPIPFAEKTLWLTNYAVVLIQIEKVHPVLAGPFRLKHFSIGCQTTKNSEPILWR